MSAPHAQNVKPVLQALGSSDHGLTRTQAMERLRSCGLNAMPEARQPGFLHVFLHQFASPLIYVLAAAAVFSMIIQAWSDAGFIAAVLLLNAIIGSSQEFSAQKAAIALHRLVSTQTRVLRDGDAYEINSEQLVPGDIVLLESGDRIPADIRLIGCNDLEVDESLLTGESVPVLKHADLILDEDTILGDRSNMAFTGTLVNRGRGNGVVVNTAQNTELGKIAAAVLGKKTARPPLLVRMERFTHRIALFVAIAAIIMAFIVFIQGMDLTEIFMLAVALAVSAIPEGLPVALTVALAIGMRRMARRHVIVRQLVAVEALGSCTYIATDKTGTLTANQLTVRKILIPGNIPWEVSGESEVPVGDIHLPGKRSDAEQEVLLRLALTAVLSNEGFIGHRDGNWIHHGDAVDVALLIMAHKAGVNRADSINRYPELSSIPFESERQFSASLNQVGDQKKVFVKGALEKLLPMCDHMVTLNGDIELDGDDLINRAEELARDGFRILALASGDVDVGKIEEFCLEHLTGLNLIGLVALIDPLRPEVGDAIEACRNAGIQVAMITGDHPTTAFAIGHDLKLVDTVQQIVTGPQIKEACDDKALDRLVPKARVFARIEPQQKLDIVQSLQRNGHFVAVSGDGANDAPALRAAQVGVAMGKQGTDVARESAELIITDDNFSSIVAGIEEGRIAYANVRKVIFLLVSTGAAELVLFTLSLLFGLPIPLLAVQLLWLNLITNGIQDIALAFEPGEGNELRRPPRPPREPIFNRIMIERILTSALVIGGMAFYVFQWLLSLGLDLDEARNYTLLLMVLFENVHVFNSRSETRSAFTHSPLRNPLLLFGTLIAQLIHIGAMYTPWISDVLTIQPVSPERWMQLLGFALSVLLVMEAHKLVRRYTPLK